MKISVFILLLFFAGGCIPLTDYENTQEYHADPLLYLDEGHTARQTLHLRRRPAESLTLWIAHPAQGARPATGLTLTLEGQSRRGPQRVRQTYALPPLAAPAATPFTLPATDYLPSSSLTLTLQVSGGGLWLYGRAEEAYPQGALSLDGLPRPGDLAFRLTYAYGPSALWSDFRALLPRLWLLLPLLALLLLPGWAVWGSTPRDAPPVPLRLLVPLSAAFWPLLLAWTSLLRLRWSPLLLWGAALSLGGWGAYAARRARRNPPRAGFAAVGGILVFLLVLASRLIMVRDLAAPPWVDSVHHALITRLIVEQGVYPATYAPYGETANAHYHSGFHALSAAFITLSGLEISTALLLLGQILNALVATLGAYTFTCALGFSRRAGLLAALIAGLFTPMPAYYLSWGRYTQLAGLLLLPAAFAAWRAGEKTASRLPFALLFGGLLITHYRVTAFLLLLLAAWELSRLGKGSLRRLLPRLQAFGLGLLLAAPWGWPALRGFIAPKTAAWSTAVQRTAWFQDFSWRYLNAGWGGYTLGLAALGLVWAMRRHRRAALTLLLWAGGMFLLANLGALGLPGRAWVNNTSVEITLFLPIAALGGLLLDSARRAGGRLLSTRGTLHPRARRAALSLGNALLFGWAVFHGLRATLGILNPATVLFHQADRPAMQWIEASLPPDAVVVINPAAWGYGLYVGADGGYWISPLTGRRTLPPTLLYGWGESAEIRRYNALGKALLEAAADPAALASLMEENGAAYVYLGARGGPFSAEALQNAPRFTALYHQGDTWVFGLLPALAGGESLPPPANR